MMPLVLSLTPQLVHVVTGAYELCTEHSKHFIYLKHRHNYVVNATIVTVTHLNVHRSYISTGVAFLG